MKISNKYNNKDIPKIPENELTLDNRLFLATILRAGLAENIDSIIPLNQISQVIAPTKEFSHKMINNLIEHNLIRPHPDNPPSSFIDDENFPDNFFVDNVYYLININPSDNNYQSMIERLMYPPKEIFYSEKEFCYETWKTIALYEAIEYLNYSLDKVGFKFNPGKKTRTVFEYLLQHFSVSQIYGIIYKAVANSTKIFQEKKLSRNHASNTVITLCESYGERAIAEGWKLPNYNRNNDLPESLISKVFYTAILQIASLGFHETPSVNF